MAAEPVRIGVVRLYEALVEERTQWTKRIHAELYQHGVAVPEGNIRAEETRARLASDAVRLSAAGRQRINVGYRMIDATDGEALPLKAALQRFGTRQPRVQGPGWCPLRDRSADRGGCVVRGVTTYVVVLQLRVKKSGVQLSPARPRTSRVTGAAVTLDSSFMH